MLESVRDSSGKVVAENFYPKDELADMVGERMYGRSRGEKDLREVLKTKKTVGNFVVLKSRKPSNLKSRFECTPKKVIKETEHMVTVEGGKMFHKKDVADCSQLMLDISFQKPNKPDRGIIRSTENGQFKRKSSEVDLKKAKKNKILASTGSSDPTAQRGPVQTDDQSGGQTAEVAEVTGDQTATVGETTAESTAVDEADLQAQANDSVDVDKQASFDGAGPAQNDALVATQKSPIYSANAPIKPIPGNYTDIEDSSVVRRSNRLPTAKRVNKYGGVSYN